jgi:hypothetical protein
MAAKTGYLIDAGFLEDAERDLEWYRGRGAAWSLSYLFFVPALDLARGRPEAAVPAFQQALETALRNDLSVAYQAAASRPSS